MTLTDWLSIIAAVIALAGAGLLFWLYRQGVLSKEGIAAVGSVLDDLHFEGSFLATLAYYCSLAVKAVEQMVKAGVLEKDDGVRKDAAVDFVLNYAAVDGYELTDDDREAIGSLIEAKVYEQNAETKQHPPESK